LIWIILYFISLLSNLFPLVGAIYFYNKLDRLQVYLFYYAVYIVVAQVINSIIARVLHLDTIWFFEVYLIIQLIYFVWFYNKWKKTNRIYMVFNFLFIGFILVLEYYQYFIFPNSYKEVSYTFPLLFIFFIIQNAIVIIKTFDLSDTEFNKSCIFWVAFSNLIYFMAILPFNIYSFFGSELKGELLTIYRYTDGTINHLANITLNTILMYSFSCRKL